MFITASISLTQIGKLVRENPDLARKVTFKDGHTEQYLSIAIGDKKQPDASGNTLNVNCKPKGVPFDVKWYIGSGKDREQASSNVQSNTSAPQASVPTGGGEDSEFPF